ncbi:MAG: hypothetical protein EXS55_03265, partial [Candidatus Magasanikbacteria bacterium]|nr:hypothetical protein [Candidatus Magasanikbacteria bacterium]
DSDQLSGFSNYGKCVDLVAPGEKVFSAERYAPQYGYNRTFGGPWKGTSFAAPLVAGAAALLKSLHSEWGPDKITETLLNSARPIDAVNLSFVGKIGRGSLDVGSAVAVAAALKKPNRFSGYYYWFASSTIKRLNFDTDRIETITTLPGEKIRALAVYNPNFGSKAQLAVLLERRAFFYVRLLKDSGEIINEFSLELPIRKDIVVKHLRTTALQSAPARFIVEVYYPKKKQTIFKAFNERGEVVRELAVNGIVENWTMERYDGGLIVTQKIGKILQLRRLSWNSSPSAPIALGSSGVVVEAVRSGRVTQGKVEQPIVILRRGNRIEQQVVDLVAGISSIQLITETRDRAPWRLLLADSTASEEALIFPFATGGGIFRLIMTRGEPVAEIKLPELAGTTD